MVEVCQNNSERYEIHFIKIGADENHFHFLIQSVPKIFVEIIVSAIKSITTKKIFQLHVEVKSKL